MLVHKKLETLELVSSKLNHLQRKVLYKFFYSGVLGVTITFCSHDIFLVVGD